jgi:ribosome-associated translation inhibitor RaiA
MKVRYAYQDVEPAVAEQWPQLFEKSLEREVAPLLEKNKADETVIYVTLSKSKRDGKFHASVHAYLPGKKIVAVKSAQAVLDSLAGKIAKTLFREVKKHFDRLRGQSIYKRKARRHQLRQLKAAIASRPQDTVSEAEEVITRFLDQLKAVARRELAYLRASGDLPADYPTVEDVVDEAVAATLAEREKGMSPEYTYRLLLKNLFKAIDRELAVARQYGTAIPIDMPMPPDAKDQSEQMVEEEFYEYYQPDDSVSLADVLPAEAAETPEEELSEAELETASEGAYKLDVMKDLPIQWRRAYQLVHTDSMSKGDVAVILNTTETHVEYLVGQADSFVRARLEDAGLKSQDE